MNRREFLTSTAGSACTLWVLPERCFTARYEEDDEILKLARRVPSVGDVLILARHLESEASHPGDPWKLASQRLLYFQTIRSQQLEWQRIRAQATSDAQREELLADHVSRTVAILCSPEEVNLRAFGSLCADQAKHEHLANRYAEASKQVGLWSGVSIPIGVVSTGVGTILGAVGFAGSAYLGMLADDHRSTYVSESFMTSVLARTMRAAREEERRLVDDTTAPSHVVPEARQAETEQRHAELDRIARAPLENATGQARYRLDPRPLDKTDVERMRDEAKEQLKEHLERMRQVHAVALRTSGRTFVAEYFERARDTTPAGGVAQSRLAILAPRGMGSFDRAGNLRTPSTAITLRPGGLRSLHQSPIMNDVDRLLTLLSELGVLRLRITSQHTRDFLYWQDVSQKHRVVQEVEEFAIAFVSGPWTHVELNTTSLNATPWSFS